MLHVLLRKMLIVQQLAENFLKFNLIFSGFLYHYWISLSYPTLSSFFHSTVYLYSLWAHLAIIFIFFEFIQVLIHVFFNFIDHSYHCSFEFIHFIIIPFIVELLVFRWYMLPFFSYYVCFYIGIHVLVQVKSLVGSLNCLYSFSWNSLNVQTGQSSDQAEVLFLTTGLGACLGT
jgi:hypothetical protein